MCYKSRRCTECCSWIKTTLRKSSKDLERVLQDKANKFCFGEIYFQHVSVFRAYKDCLDNIENCKKFASEDYEILSCNFGALKQKKGNLQRKMLGMQMQYITQQTRVMNYLNSEDGVMRFPRFSDCNILPNDYYIRMNYSELKINHK